MTGIDRIAAERARHQELGWTAEHDDQHSPEELELAAACYAMPESLRLYGYDQQADEAPHFWPFADKYWKPSTRERDLEKAGALLAAALDLRMRRAGEGEV